MKTAALSSLLATCFLLAAAEAKVYYTKVAILGGGVSGISAALNLTAAGITDFMVIEARDILGGRAQDKAFADVNVELGCNWVQGLGTNPINQLALKYNLSTAESNSDDVVWYGENGQYNGTDLYNKLNDHYDTLLGIACKFTLSQPFF
jgi:polyamine oxidase